MSRTIEEVYKAMHFQLMWTIGIMIGILITGGLISFGISCIFLLSVYQDPETLRQHRLLRVYIVALLFFVTSYMVVQVLWCNVFIIFYPHSPLDGAERFNSLVILFGNLVPVFVAALTDGLFVWRCYMIQKLPLRHGPSQWQKIFWIFPAFLWGLTIVTASVAVPLVLAPSRLNVASALEAIALFSNVTLNIYATLFISFRLLNHRRMIVKLVGNKVDTSYYKSIVGILWESAAINVPMTIAVAVGIGLRAPFGKIIVPIAITSQAFASVIIIHRVAVGRAFSQKQEELSQFVVETRISGDLVTPTDAASLAV